MPGPRPGRGPSGRGPGGVVGSGGPGGEIGVKSGTQYAFSREAAELRIVSPHSGLGGPVSGLRELQASSREPAGRELRPATTWAKYMARGQLSGDHPALHSLLIVAVEPRSHPASRQQVIGRQTEPQYDHRQSENAKQGEFRRHGVVYQHGQHAASTSIRRPALRAPAVRDAPGLAAGEPSPRLRPPGRSSA